MKAHITVEYDKLQVMHLDNLHALEYTFCWSTALGSIYTTGYRNYDLFTVQHFRDQGKDPKGSF
jgi:hypothetical protein